MWRAIRLWLIFMAGLLAFTLAGCASIYPPTVHYGVSVGYGSYWNDSRDRHHHHYHHRPSPKPPNRPKPPHRPRPRPRPRPGR